ncbi:hypothetical protein DLM78_17495 [Leptospira stimsonii]|uniref:Uncharacterized protein n=1 Tax=Leptospira stimsonii TaxID=2202203 RepID=A0A8B3CQA1_9LEPT|nr:hypothetical protein DLM78_17495 [Leptospira stimsonii]
MELLLGTHQTTEVVLWKAPFVEFVRENFLFRRGPLHSKKIGARARPTNELGTNLNEKKI